MFPTPQRGASVFWCPPVDSSGPGQIELAPDTAKSMGQERVSRYGETGSARGGAKRVDTIKT